MSEIIFIVENSNKGGYTAKFLSYSIYTKGQTIDELKENIKDAIKCHFDGNQRIILTGKYRAGTKIL